LQQEVFFLDLADGERHNAEVAADAVIDVHHVITRLEVHKGSQAVCPPALAARLFPPAIDFLLGDDRQAAGRQVKPAAQAGRRGHYVASPHVPFQRPGVKNVHPAIL